jgi:gliding motility-associated lipoprotein GldH
MKRGKNKCLTAKGAFLGKLGAFGFLFFILNACSSNSFYEKNSTIDDQLWFRRQVPEFEIHTIDTNQSFDIFVHLRHSSSYKYSNLSLMIEEVNPQKEEKAYRLEIELAESDGRWKGIGTGNVLSYEVLLLKDHHFADTGTYTFKIKQNMNINPLPGILDVGIQVVK